LFRNAGWIVVFRRPVPRAVDRLLMKRIVPSGMGGIVLSAAPRLSAAARIAASLGLIAFGALVIAVNQNSAWCGDGRSITPEARISACTRVLHLGRLFSRSGPADTYNNRGLAYSASRDYDRALVDFDTAIQRSPNYAVAFNNRGNVHLVREDFERAFADYDAAVRFGPTLRYVRKNRGYAHFLNADYAAAARDLAYAADGRRDELYPLLWLYLARARAGDGSAVAELESNSVGWTDAGEWPHPVMNLYLGRTTAEAVVAAARDSDQRCEAAFYLGAWRLLRAERAAAIENFKSAAAACPIWYVERAGARAELKRLAP
jgi:lipoprotein NlpI